MTFEEAKQRPDYCFRLNGIQLLIRDIREEHLEIDLDNGPLIGKAVLEIGYVDIEVNISVLGMFGEMPAYKPIIEYFMCFKTENDWEPIGDILELMQMWIGGAIDGKKSWKKICF